MSDDPQVRTMLARRSLKPFIQITPPKFYLKCSQTRPDFTRDNPQASRLCVIRFVRRDCPKPHGRISGRGEDHQTTLRIVITKREVSLLSFVLNFVNAKTPRCGRLSVQLWMIFLQPRHELVESTRDAGVASQDQRLGHFSVCPAILSMSNHPSSNIQNLDRPFGFSQDAILIGCETNLDHEWGLSFSRILTRNPLHVRYPRLRKAVHVS